MMIDRQRIILQMRKEKLSYRRIGRVVGLSAQGVWNIVNGRKSTRRPKRLKPPKPKLPVFLRTGEVARLLDISTNTVRRWEDEGLLHSHRIGPRQDRRFRKDEIEKSMRAGLLKRRRKEGSKANQREGMQKKGGD